MTLDAEASCNAAIWIGTMPCLKEISLHKVSFHNEFHSRMVSMVQSSKVGYIIRHFGFITLPVRHLENYTLLKPKRH